MQFNLFDLIKHNIRSGEECNELIKLLVFIYVLKKSNIDIPTFNNDETTDKYCSRLCTLVNEKLIEMQSYCDDKLLEIVKDCIVSFNLFYTLNLSKDYITKYFINLSSEEIKEIIVNYKPINIYKENLCTPKSLINFVIKLLIKDEDATWFDIGCGTGDLLVELAENYKFKKCIGEDINHSSQLIAKIRLYFLCSNYFIRENNVLNSSYNEIADVAFANTPFVMRLSQNYQNYNEKNKYVGELKINQNCDWIFADRLIQSIKDRGAIVMTEASLMNFIDIHQRKNVILANLVEGVIKLPGNLFSYTNIPTSLVIFNKNKKDRYIRFLDATNMCINGRRLSELKVNQIISAYYNETSITKVLLDKISPEDYSLNVKKYLDVNDIVLENESTLEGAVEEIFRGAQISASTIDEISKFSPEDDTCKLLSIGDIQNGFFNSNQLLTVKNEGKYNRYLLQNGDILISSKGTKIKTAVTTINKDEKIVATGSLLVVRCDKNKVNPYYLKAFFDSNNGTKILESIQTGTTIISINASALLRLRIPLINMEKQEKIAHSYLITLELFKCAQLRLQQLEKDIVDVFDKFYRG